MKKYLTIKQILGLIIWVVIISLCSISDLLIEDGKEIKGNKLKSFAILLLGWYVIFVQLDLI